jgi:RNA polymerase sigma factor (TIGR02999 family)
MFPDMSDVTLVLDAISRDGNQASEKLLPLVYDALRKLAAARMAREGAGHTLQPTALVHEAWVRLVEGRAQTWENRGHFFGAASEAMRRILIERARHKSRLKYGAGQERLNIEDIDIAEALPDDKLLLVDEALERLKTEDPEVARVVVMKFFGGLTNAEIVEITGTSDRTVRRQWEFAKSWMFKTISKSR